MKRFIHIFTLLMLLSLSTLGQTSIKGTTFNVRDFGAKGDGVTSDQTAIATTLTACVAAGGGIVKLPKGTYLVTGLTVPGGVTLQGDGREVSIIYSTTNAVIVNATEGAAAGVFEFKGPSLFDLTIRGTVTAGTSQKGLQMDDGSYYFGSVVERVNIENTGDNGLYVGNVFSSVWRDMFITNCADYPLLYDAANMPTNYFYGIYIGNVRASAPTGFRIKRGLFNCQGCNGINNIVAASRWAAVGTKNGVDGDSANVGAQFECYECNYESWVGYGIYAYAYSTLNLRSFSSFGMDATGAGTGIPIYFENNGDGADYFAQLVPRGVIEDTVSFANTLSDYANSQPIHAAGFAFIETAGNGPSGPSNARISTFRNTTTSANVPLSRKDGQTGVTTVTTTTSFAQPGLKYIEANCAAACQITLPWGGYYATGYYLTIKDISGAAATNNITIAANSGATVNGSSYVMNQNGQSITLVVNGAANGGNGDWRVVSNTPATATVTGSGVNGRVTFWTGTQTQSSDGTFFWDDTNNRLGVGTATPGLPLDVVADNTALAQQWRENGAGTARVQLQIPSSYGQIGTSSNHSFALITNGTQRVNVESTGGTVFGSIVAAQATVHSNAIANTDVAILGNNASGSTTDILKLQVAGSNRYRFLSTGAATFGLASTAAGTLTFANASNSNTVTLQPGVTGSNLTFTLPIADGTSGQCMQTNGSGVLSFASCGGSPSLTATYIGYGGGGGTLTGSANHTWDETNKIETLTSGSTAFIRLAAGSTASGIQVNYNLGGTGAIHPGSGGGLLMPFVGGSQSSGPGIWWTNNAYNATAGLWISNGLNWQGHSSAGSPFKVRTGTGTSSDGTVRFTLAPDSSLFTQNASTSQTGANTDLEVVDLVSTGTAGTNFGAGRLYTLENGSGSQVNAMRLATRWAVATAGSETTTTVIANNNAGLGLGESFTIQADQYHGVYASANITGGATINFNNGNVQELTFTGNVTSTTLSNIKEGAIYFIIFKQSVGGGNTLTSTNIKVTGGSLALTATANARDLFQCVAISTNLYCSKALDVK